ncbi:MAG: glycosyltransferase family 39 protein [Parcubacteria group bacterium]|jgi:4-amino-4-deoxy-L-arabinose transferase-like glycosyltransferase
MKFFRSSFEKAKQNKLTLAIFLVIFLTGIFLRSYHFSDWLHFEIDQTYDINIVSNAVQNGPGNLPLLGPTAGGGRSLRLGPAFYYMEYLSALIFGNTPAGHAAQVLILGILAMPLFYFFCRRYFSKNLSLALLAIFSFSSYLVLYSRFSWSPDVLPFLVLFCFYALLKSVSEKEEKKEYWFLLAAFFVALTSQIHFNAFFIVPAVTFFFLLIKRPRFRWKIWLAAIAIFLAVYSPVVISDVKTGGQNLSYFLERLPFHSGNETEKTESKDKKSWEKVVQDIRYNVGNYFLINSGIDNINGSHLTGSSWGILCKSCQKKLAVTFLPFVLFIASFFILLLNLKTERDQRRRDLLLLILLWIIFSFACYFLVLYDGLYVYPRFFLPVAPLAIIFFGFLLEKLYFPRKKLTFVIPVIIVAVLSYSNISRIKDSFNQLSRAQNETFRAQTEDIFPDNTRVTLSQQLPIVDYIESKYKANGYPICIRTTHEYEPVYWYYLEKRGIDYYDIFSADKAYDQGNYFYIEQESVLNGKKGLSSILATYDIIQEKNFGILTAFYLKPKNEIITAQRQDPEDKKIPIEEFQISQLLTWNKLFSTP